MFINIINISLLRSSNKNTERQYNSIILSLLVRLNIKILSFTNMGILVKILLKHKFLSNLIFNRIEKELKIPALDSPLDITNLDLDHIMGDISGDK